MLRPKQLFIIMYVNVCVKPDYPHKSNNNILFLTQKFRKVNFRPMIEFAMIELGI